MRPLMMALMSPAFRMGSVLPPIPLSWIGGRPYSWQGLMLVQNLLFERFTIAQESSFAKTSVVNFTWELCLVCTLRIACVRVALLAILSFSPPLLRKRRLLFCGLEIFSLFSLMRTCLIVHSFFARGGPHSEELELSWRGLNSLSLSESESDSLSLISQSGGSSSWSSLACAPGSGSSPL